MTTVISLSWDTNNTTTNNTPLGEKPPKRLERQNDKPKHPAAEQQRNTPPNERKPQF